MRLLSGRNTIGSVVVRSFCSGGHNLKAQPLRTKYSRYGGSIGCYRESTSRYGRMSIGRSSNDSQKEFEGVSDRVLSEQPISRMIDIKGTVKLLGKGKLEFNRYPRL